MTGRAWIFLRGLSRGQGHWGDFVEKFKEAFPTDEVELLDIPGNGFRNRESSPVFMKDYVNMIRKESKLLKKKKPVNMLAISLGGMVAVEWMKRYPSDLNHVILINTSSGGVASTAERFLISNYPKVLMALKLKSIEEREKLIANMVMNNKERLRLVLPKLIEHTVQYPHAPENFIRQIAAASQVKFPAIAPGKITLFGSEGDRLVSVECTKKIADMWGIQPLLHPWAGHDLPVDDPAWLIQKITELNI